MYLLSVFYFGFNPADSTYTTIINYLVDYERNKNMNMLANFDLDFDTIPLGNFWNTLAGEAPNCYQYEMIITKFLSQK